MNYKKLKDLLKEVDYVDIRNESDAEVRSIKQDSRKVEPHGVFVAIRGVEVDGHKYLNDLIGKHLSAIFCEEYPDKCASGTVYVKCIDTRLALAQLASAFYGHPSRDLNLVGITGTNGKTTVASLLYQLFDLLGFKAGLISTIDIRIGKKIVESKLTTPDILHLNEVLVEMRDSGCEYVFMEVSSHAVDQKRIAGLKYRIGVFTNITRDHLDYHGNFKNYIQAKSKFFEGLDKDAVALTNTDDRNGMVMLEKTKARIKRYSLRSLVEFKGKVLSEDMFGLTLNFNGATFYSSMIGMFNAYNLLAIYGVAECLLGEEQRNVILEKMSSLKSARGRMEVVNSQPLVLVDYAHTPDALQNVLETIKKSALKSKLILVVGCGGDRDPGKRPMMGKIAVNYADTAIFTSDNPRKEDPIEIVDQMKKELTKDELNGVLEIIDRKTAIRTACKLASEDDVVLIAGKGHEEYQDIMGERKFFSDQIIVKEIFSKDI